MPKTMKAAVVREFCKPLVIEEAAVPEPGTGQIQSRSRHRVCVTRICTPPRATGR